MRRSTTVLGSLRGRPEGSLLRLLFFGLAGMSIVVLLLDFRALEARGRHDVFGLPSRQPVRMDRPTRDDQIRPYLPHSRPLAPDDPRRGRPRDDKEAAPMDFRLGTGGAAFADGTITPGTADAFREFLDAGPAGAITEIVLHSPGGSVEDAMRMAALIHERGLDTRILPDGYCASSCPLVFAAGAARIAADTSWIGVHQIFALSNAYGTLSEGLEQAQSLSAEAQLQLVEFGVDPRVWIHAMQTPKDELYLFTPDELTGLNLATSVEPAEASPS